MKQCECGCKLEFEPSIIYRGGKHEQKFLPGHNKGNKNKIQHNVSKRTYHKRARQIVIQTEKCEINDCNCSGLLEVAHIDQNHLNNERSNLKTLCRTHHRILDNRFKFGMTFEKLKKTKLDFYVDSSGKKRYRW